MGYLVVVASAALLAVMRRRGRPPRPAAFVDTAPRRRLRRVHRVRRARAHHAAGRPGRGADRPRPGHSPTRCSPTSPETSADALGAAGGGRRRRGDAVGVAPARRGRPGPAARQPGPPAARDRVRRRRSSAAPGSTSGVDGLARAGCWRWSMVAWSSSPRWSSTRCSPRRSAPGTDGAPFSAVLRNEVRAQIGIGSAIGATGALIALAATIMGFWALPVFVVPLLLTQFSFRRYAAIRAVDPADDPGALPGDRARRLHRDRALRPGQRRCPWRSGGSSA